MSKLLYWLPFIYTFIHSQLNRQSSLVHHFFEESACFGSLSTHVKNILQSVRLNGIYGRFWKAWIFSWIIRIVKHYQKSYAQHWISGQVGNRSESEQPVFSQRTTFDPKFLSIDAVDWIQQQWQMFCIWKALRTTKRLRISKWIKKFIVNEFTIAILRHVKALQKHALLFYPVQRKDKP